MDHAQQAVKADASLLSAQYTLGLAAMAARDFLQAERAFEAAAQINPRAAAPQMQLAKLRLARGDTGGAVAAAEMAASDRPDNPESAVLLAQTLRARGDLERASRELGRRIAAAPDSAPLHVEMGRLHLERGDTAGARASFNEALRAAPGSIEARQGLLTADIAEKKFDGARRRVAAWQASEPGNLPVKTLAARVELATGDLRAAERLLRRVLEKDASQLEAYELLGGAYARQGRIDEAIRQYESLAQRSAEKATAARTMVGMLHEARQDRGAARNAFEQVLSNDPRAGVAANNLAWIYVADGRLDDALRMAKVAQDALRRRPEPDDTAGWVYLKKGIPTEAIPAFERARDRAPQNPIYHYHLGLAYAQTGDEERAAAALQRALELKPDFAGADDARAQLASLAKQRAAR
jgi:tetratricopeptide (TPR) repeat protein